LTGATLPAKIGCVMGRVREHIKVDGHQYWTLFDTGARNTYIIPAVANDLMTKKMAAPFRTALGGEIKEARSSAILEAEVEGHRIATHALVIDEIGRDEDGKPIEVLFGALAMQQWGIRPIPDQEKLDLTHYPKEFVEY
jgi:Aspartyl protease